MTSKQTLRLTLVTVAFVVTLAIVLGLFMMLIPAAQTASADIEVGGGYYDDEVYEWVDPEDDMSKLYIRVQDNDSGNFYQFFWTGSSFFNPDFVYPSSYDADYLLNGKWTVEVNTSDDFMGLDFVLDLSQSLVARYATYDSNGDQPGEYVVGDITKPGTYCVVISQYMGGIDVDVPLAWLTVDIRIEAGPFTQYMGEVNYGEYTGEQIIDAIVDQYGNSFGKLDSSYDYGYGTSHIIVSTAGTDRDDDWARLSNWSNWYDTEHDKSEKLPAGDYELYLQWHSYGIYDEGSAVLYFTVNPVVVEWDFYSGNFTRQWGDLDLTAYQPMSIESNPNANLVWYYDDGSEDGAVLPSGLDLEPGDYQVWPVLEGSDVTAGNVVLKRITVDMDEVNKANPYTLTINAIDMSYSIANDAFTDLTYGDPMSFGFRTNVYTMYASRLATAYSNWGGIDFDVYWYYEDAEGEHQFNEFCNAGSYTLKYRFTGSRLYGITGELINATYLVDIDPVKVTIGKATITDATVVIGSTVEQPLIMYTGKYIEASHLNNLYYVPEGIVLKVKSMSNPEVVFGFDGWKRNPADEEEEPVTNLSELLDKEYYLYNVYALKNVGTFENPEWVKDTNYTVDQLSCAVKVNKRRIKIEPYLGMIYYNGTEQYPDFTVTGVDGYLNPNEGAAPEFTFANPWDYLEETFTCEHGTNVGSYMYGVMIKDEFGDRFVCDDGMGNLSVSATWGYSIEQMVPTFDFSKVEDWWYSEAIQVNPGSEDDDFIQYLNRKLTLNLVTTDIEGDEVFVDYVTWSPDDGVHNYYPIDDKFDQYVANYIGKSIKFTFYTTESLSGNVQSWSDSYTFFVEKAPVYFIHNDSDVAMPDYDGYMHAIAWYNWPVVLYHELDGVSYTDRAEFTSDYNMDGDITFDDFFGLDAGSNGATMAGQYSFTIGFSADSYTMISDYFEIIEPVVEFAIPWKQISIEKFDLPTDFTYGDEEGSQTPEIDFTNDSDAIVGASSGWTELLGPKFKRPIAKWEFTADPAAAAGESYTGEWTLWTDSIYPKDAGTYYVRYSARFYWNDHLGVECTFKKNLTEIDTYNDEIFNWGMFELSYQYGSFRINPKDVTLNWSGLNNEYDGNNHCATISTTGLVYGEALEDVITYTDSSFVDYTNGGYALSAEVVDNAIGNKNYNIVNPTATLIIDKKKVTVIAEDKSLSYGEAKPTLTYYIDGFVAGEDEAGLRAAGRLAGAPVLDTNYVQYTSGVTGSPYVISCSEATEGYLEALNYTFEYQDAEITVAKTNFYPSIWQDAEVVYTGSYLDADGALEYDYGTFSDGIEDLVFTYSKTEGSYVSALPTWKDAGTYTVYFKVESDNYNTYTGDFDFTISKATITGTIEQNGTLVYDGNEKGAITNTLTTVDGVVFTAINYRTTSEGSYNLNEKPMFITAGTHDVYFKAVAPNHYDYFGYYSITIDQRVVDYTFKIDGEARYSVQANGSEHNVTVAINNKVEGDTLGIELSGTYYATAYGEGYEVLLTLTGASKANYMFDNNGSTKYEYWSVGISAITNVSVAQSGAHPVYAGAYTAVATVTATATTEGSVPYTFYYADSYIDKETTGWSTSVPRFTSAGTFTVYYKVEAEGHTTYWSSDAKFDVVVDKAPITLSVSVSGKTYDGAAITAPVVSGNDGNANYTVQYQKTAPVVGVITSDLPADAGTYKVIYTVEESANYFGATDDSVTFVIAQKTVTVTIDQTQLIYNGASQKPAATVNGIVGDDEVSVLWSDEVTKNAGEYNNVTFTFSGFSAANYTIANNKYSFTIAQKELTINWKIDALAQNVASLTYDGQTHGVTVIASTGVVGETVALAVYGDKEGKVNWQQGGYTAYVGSSETDTDIKAKGSTAYNYVIYTDTDNRTFNWSIDKRAITVTVNAKTSTYGDAQVALDAVVTWNDDVTGTAIIGGDTVYSLACDVTKTSQVGKYAITGTATNTNYAVSFVGENQAYTVTPRAITIAIDAKEAEYGEDQVALTADESQIVNGDEGVYSLSCAVSKTTKVGTYAITGTALDGNYAITFTGEADAYTVLAREITITIDKKSAEYGDEQVALTADESEIVNGDKGVYSLSCGVTKTTKVGKYAITGTPLDENYAITFVGEAAAYQVVPRAITIAVAAKSSVYGDEPVALTADESAIVNGDKGVYSLACDVTAASNVGKYDVIGTALDGNYAITFTGEADAYTVVARAITITADDKQSIYGDAAATLTAVATLDADEEGIAIIGEDQVYVLTCEVSATTGIGTYAINVVPANNANYVVTAVGAEYTVVARNITIAIDAKTSVFGDALVALTADESQIVNGDAEVYSLASTVTATSAVGKYAITGTALDENYNITFVGEADAYTLTQRELTLAWGETSFVYNSAAQVPTATIGNTVNGQAVAVSVAGEKVAVGEYTATASINNANYKLPAVVTKAFSITKKALTVTADAKKVGYGDYAPEQSFYSVSYDGFAGTEDKAVLGGSLVYTVAYKQYDKAGSYDIVPSGLTSDNYAITFVKGTLTVEAGEFEEVKVAEGGKVEVEIDTSAAADKGVDINKIIETAAKAGANAGVTLTVGEGAKASSIVLDAAAVQALAGKDVKLSYEVKEGEAAATAVKGAELVLEITLSGMDQGTATITVPFENNAPTGKVAKIFYVDENGKKTDMKGVFENGNVTFTTDHNSTYMVSYVLSTATIVGIIVAVVAVIAIVVVLVIVMGKKKKGAAPAAKEEAPAKEEETPSEDAE